MPRQPQTEREIGPFVLLARLEKRIEDWAPSKWSRDSALTALRRVRRRLAYLDEQERIRRLGL